MTAPNEDAPLRVVFVIGTLNRGGTEGQVVALATRLRQRGHLVRIVCMDRAGDLREEVTAAGVEVVEAGFRGIKRESPRSLLRFLLRMYRAIRGSRPHVVHCFLYVANIFGAPLGRLAGARTVLISERSLQSAVRSRWFFRPLVWLAHRSADAIVCNSKAVLEDAVLNGVPARKALVVYNGVEHADALTDPPSSGARIVLVIANLIAYKGHGVLLEAFARVLARLGRNAARLQLAGAGPEEDRLHALAARLGIDDAVEFLGSVSDVRPLLGRCSFTVLASESEGMPNAVLQSLAAGRAVVGTQVGGTAEILAAGGGILVPAGDPDSLAEAMGDLIADPDRARQLGREGHEVVQGRFDMERMVDETLALYRRLLIRRGTRA